MSFDDQLLVNLDEQGNDTKTVNDDADLFEQMIFGADLMTVQPGSIIEGIITIKDREYSYLSVQSKNEARILTQEIEGYEVGDTIEVKVLREDEENLIVSKFLLDKEREYEKYSEGNVVSGKIKKKVKGGFQVAVGKNEGFLPFSLSLFNPNGQYINETFEFLIKEKGKKTLTLSRVDLVQKSQDEFFQSNKIGDVLDAVVKDVLEFGVILEANNVYGLLHISEVDWNQVKDLNEKFKIGDTVTVKIIEKNEENKKIKYSIKQLQEDPFDIFTKNHKIGDILNVDVVETLDFGLKVKIDDNIGFIHVSELDWGRPYEKINNYKVGDKLEAKLIIIDQDKRNIKLSVKQLTENPWDSVKEKYKVGDVLSLPVKDILDFGIVFEIESTINGFLHISDISYKKTGKLDDLYKIGDILDVQVIGYNDEKERVSLSVKPLIDKSWEKLANTVNIDDVVKGSITNIQKYGIFVEIEKNIEAFIHYNEFAWNKDEIKEYKVGDEVEFKIVNLEVQDRKLAGSIKRLTQSPWSEASEKYSIGNKIKIKIVDIKNNYVLVKLTERFNGIIPISELSSNRIENINDHFSEGEEVEAIVIDSNENKKSIILSIKRIQEQIEKEEMDNLLQQYSVDAK